MPIRVHRKTTAIDVLVVLLMLVVFASPRGARAQMVEDGSDAAIGKANARIVLDLIAQRFKELGPKVSSLRKADGTWICGSVNVKNRDGLYSGERGFVVDLSNAFFGRVPDGPEMLNPRVEGFQAMEEIRQAYFKMCMD